MKPGGEVQVASIKAILECKPGRSHLFEQRHNHIRRGNATRSKVRAFVEHVFTDQKHRLGMKIRTIGLARAKIKIGLCNIAYNIRRLIMHERSVGKA